MPKAIARITTTPASFASAIPANDAGPANIDTPNFDGARTGKAYRIAALLAAAEATVPARVDVPAERSPFIDYRLHLLDPIAEAKRAQAAVASRPTLDEILAGEVR